MVIITGKYLKTHGELIISNNSKAIIKITNNSKIKRSYFYLVKLCGKKYTRPYRLKQNEYDYYFDTLTKEVELYKRTKND